MGELGGNICSSGVYCHSAGVSVYCLDFAIQKTYKVMTKTSDCSLHIRPRGLEQQFLSVATLVFFRRDLDKCSF